MAEVKKINGYIVKDETARTNIATMKNNISALQSQFSAMDTVVMAMSGAQIPAIEERITTNESNIAFLSNRFAMITIEFTDPFKQANLVTLPEGWNSANCSIVSFVHKDGENIYTQNALHIYYDSDVTDTGNNTFTVNEGASRHYAIPKITVNVSASNNFAIWRNDILTLKPYVKDGTLYLYLYRFGDLVSTESGV